MDILKYAVKIQNGIGSEEILKTSPPTETLILTWVSEVYTQ